MLRLSLIVVTVVAGAASQIPPKQTNTQKQLIARIDAAAAEASRAAVPALLSVLEAPEFTAGLAKCCSRLVGKSGTELLSLLTAEVKAAELTHNFHAVNNKAAWENDVSIATLTNATYFYNLWQLAYLKLSRPGVQVGQNDVEHTLLGFPDFTGANGMPASFAEASER